MKKKSISPKTKGEKRLGDFAFEIQKFGNLPKYFKEFQSKDFQRLDDRNKYERVNQALLDLIESTPTPCFLLPAVLEYIDKINEIKVREGYSFFHFEMWLNQFSNLSADKNFEVRCKIVGKRIPRDEYQRYFPIGMGKVYPGSHFVTAHGSPDLDTTIASFWGWVDAFGARVSEGLHLWNVPGGPPTAQMEIGFLFHQIFGEGVFDHLAKTRTSLSLSSFDLMTQKGLLRRSTSESALAIDHERTQNAVVLVDEKGYYLGDWRSFDVEGVRQVVLMLNNCLRWFENHLHVKLIALFAKPKLTLKDLPAILDPIFSTKLSECPTVHDLSGKQKSHLEDYLIKVLKVKKGLGCTFEQFAEGMNALGLFNFKEFVSVVRALPKSSLFNSSGVLVEKRPDIFHYLEKIIKALDNAIASMRAFVDRLEVALNIKTEVFGHKAHPISSRADVEEIKSKISNYSYLTVTAADKQGNLVPLGIVQATDLHKPVLGTVTLRDFCNREETKIPSYFEVISVIDHHKSSLQTTSAPTAIISDAQSSNVLCAELAFEINDDFSAGGMAHEQIDKQIDQLCGNLSSPARKRAMKRLLQRQLASEDKNGFFVDPAREFVEYQHFFYGILDDTDLLTKVSKRDVECVLQLINRMKSLMLQKETEVISFDDIRQDHDFARKAAARILQNEETYSLYRKIYLAKEDAIDEHITLCAKDKPSQFFADTKEQNGCAHVGQAKLFKRNYPVFAKNTDALRKRWYDQAQSFFKEHSEIDLHLQMISTLAGAEDLFKGKEGEFSHKDELWIWIPFTEQSIEHLKRFLNAFRSSPQIVKNELSAEFFGEKAKGYEDIFKESFMQIPMKIVTSKGTPSYAVLKYKAGTINSRKAMISPYLPKPVT